MKVSVITPTANRYHLLKRCVEQFEAQDYPDKELIITDQSDVKLFYSSKPDISFIGEHQLYIVKEMSLGQMRNFLCLKASGDIILHMDDDDIYASDWISRSVEALVSSAGNLTGLSNAYFLKLPDDWYLLKQPANAQPYVCGATMCYYKSMWQKNVFRNISEGEDLYFCSGAIVRPHTYIDGFTAVIHGANTCSHRALVHMKPMPAPQGT